MAYKHKVTMYGKPHTSKSDSQKHVTSRRFENGKQVKGSATHHYNGSSDYKAGENLWGAFTSFFKN